MKIIDGKLISSQIRAEIKERTDFLKEKYKKTPGLAVIIVGEDPASHIYVRNKKRACEEVGFLSEEYKLSESTSESELIDLIKKLNADEKINGILVQLPLPVHINEKSVISAIDSGKDVDAFGYENVGKIMTGDFDFVPCTPAGIMELIKRSGISVQSKNAVVIGRSNIVGKPMAMLLLHQNATVTVCHSKTENLSEITKNADIIVAAVGKPKFVNAGMVKEGAVVIDVGINRTENGLCGDVDFENVKDKVSFITPVPGGVGPMTISMLLKNTLTAFEKNIEEK